MAKCVNMPAPELEVCENTYRSRWFGAHDLKTLVREISLYKNNLPLLREVF